MNDRIYSIASSCKSSYTKDETIRYLYRYLSSCFMRYPKYFASSEEEQIKMFNSGFNLELPNVVCITLCENYKRIFDDFGIESKIIQSTDNQNDKVPLYSMIVKGDNNWFYIDPLYDLFNNQLGIRTNTFGYVCLKAAARIQKEYPFLENLSLEYISDLDKSIGIEHKNELYEKNSYDLKNRFKYDYDLPYCPTLSQIIEAKIDIILNQYNKCDSVFGPIERLKMYNYFISQVLNKKEKRNVSLNSSSEEFGYLPEIHDITSGDLYRESVENGIYTMRKIVR